LRGVVLATGPLPATRECFDTVTDAGAARAVRHDLNREVP